MTKSCKCCLSISYLNQQVTGKMHPNNRFNSTNYSCHKITIQDNLHSYASIKSSEGKIWKKCPHDVFFIQMKVYKPHSDHLTHTNKRQQQQHQPHTTQIVSLFISKKPFCRPIYMNQGVAEAATQYLVVVWLLNALPLTCLRGEPDNGCESSTYTDRE